MALATKKWSPISVYKVIAAFLIAERETRVKEKLVDTGFISAADVARLLDAPNIDNPEENYFRMKMLYRYRNVFFGELPPDTAWFEVDNLTDAELSQLHVVGRCGWDDTTRDQNELLQVAQRRQELLTTPPGVWKPIILWGHAKAGPFTIIEGNTRLVAYAGSAKAGLNIPVLVGLSENNFFFCLSDLPRLVLHDLWK